MMQVFEWVEMQFSANPWLIWLCIAIAIAAITFAIWAIRRHRRIQRASDIHTRLHAHKTGGLEFSHIASFARKPSSKRTEPETSLEMRVRDLEMKLRRDLSTSSPPSNQMPSGACMASPACMMTPDFSERVDDDASEDDDEIDSVNSDELEEQNVRIDENEEKEDVDYKIQTVYFGTNRVRDKPEEPLALRHYSAKRGDSLIIGKSEVTIPKTVHKYGEVERPRTALFGTVQIQRERRDKHFTEYRTIKLDEADFMSETAALAQEAESYQNTAFVFIHGFRVTMQNAIYRAAQMACDLNFDGPTYAYSWPAVGRVKSYVTDLDSALLAVPHLDAFLDMIARTKGVKRIHLVSHSMGNVLLTHLFLRAETLLSQRKPKVLDQLILAAPDIDRDVFSTVAEHMVKAASKVTLYASANDKALNASKRLRDKNERAGSVPPEGPVVASEVDTIDVSAVSTDLFGLNHSDYAEDRTLIDDLGRLIKTGAPILERFPTIETVKTSKGEYYRIKA
ncbi:alpha/beta fold hydrolase [Cognatiyoonia sp. IB215446]|uniref:alpha/beta hydrolase n=1 Tax=Cognatiyoonia sp. IB215446 TaxID=3097355 RepID=UPI002A101A78|nr:alpha/beta hydrolase [Cognatiyoonia sp. IB215446]MDX8348555.1 alpha/beta fold hydrolase [Cognatiyoonia sp. IB215446]